MYPDRCLLEFNTVEKAWAISCEIPTFDRDDSPHAKAVVNDLIAPVEVHWTPSLS